MLQPFTYTLTYRWQEKPETFRTVLNISDISTGLPPCFKWNSDFLIFVFFLTTHKPTQAACSSSRQEIFHCAGQMTWKLFTCTWVQSFWRRPMVHSSLPSFLPQTSLFSANKLLEQILWKFSGFKLTCIWKSHLGFTKKKQRRKLPEWEKPCTKRLCFMWLLTQKRKFIFPLGCKVIWSPVS